MDYYERNLQRKRAIENGLLELLQQFSFSQINVTRLAEHLGISRKSFYHYFSNMEACLHSLMDRMIRDAALHVTKMSDKSDYTLESYTCNLEYWRSQNAFLTALCQNQLDTVFLRRYISHSMQENRTLQTLMDAPGVEFDEDVMLFYASGQLSLLLQWCRRGFEPSAEEMAKKFLRLLCSPLIRTEEK